MCLVRRRRPHNLIAVVQSDYPFRSLCEFTVFRAPAATERGRITAANCNNHQLLSFSGIWRDGVPLVMLEGYHHCGSRQVAPFDVFTTASDVPLQSSCV